MAEDQAFSDAIRETRRAYGDPTKRATPRDLFSPLIEHAIPLALWMGGGWWVLDRYNESVVGFLGAAMMLWGGLTHGLVLAAVYGISAYALLFRKSWFRATNERRHLARVRTRVVRDLERGATGRALDRLHGLRSTYRGNAGLRRQIAAILLAEDRAADAGAILFLLEPDGPGHITAIEAFHGSVGGDPFQMLRRVIKGVSPDSLTGQERRRLAALRRMIVREADLDAWQVHAVDIYLDRAARSTVRELWQDRPWIIIEPVLLAAGLGLLWAFG